VSRLAQPPERFREIARAIFKEDPPEVRETQLP
jgi:hypothetical protein